MQILVTGGAGFIGSNFIHYWFANHSQDKIVNLDALTYAGNLDSLKDIAQNPNYRFVKGDICDSKIVREVMTGCDVVVHFAAESHVDRSITGPAVFIQTNVSGTQVLLDAAIGVKIKRFHHVSTDEVFGALELGSGDKFNENTAYNPHSPYSASKAAADHLVRAYNDTYDLPITISNCSNNFGPYHYPEKFIPLAITNLMQGKKIPVYGDGLYVRDWLYVQDHCRAIELILEKGKVGETYLIGTANEVPNIELAKKIVKIMSLDESMIECVTDRPGHDRRYAIDATKITNELGWRSQFQFDKALENTVNWYRQNKWWWEPLVKK